MSFVVNYKEHWRKAKGARTKDVLCPRCGNRVEYELVYDGDGFGFVVISPKLGFTFNKTYAYKCPICPNYELVDKEVARALIKEGR